MLGWLDGTARARTFPNAWRGIQYPDSGGSDAELVANMSVDHLDLPASILLMFCDDKIFQLAVTKMPVARNHIPIKAGEILFTATEILKPVPPIATVPQGVSVDENMDCDLDDGHKQGGAAPRKKRRTAMPKALGTKGAGQEKSVAESSEGAITG